MNLKAIGKNQVEIALDENTTVFFSYEDPVAARVKGAYYRTDKKWSTTTSRHITAWLAGNMADEKPQSFFDCIGGK